MSTSSGLLGSIGIACSSFIKLGQDLKKVLPKKDQEKLMAKVFTNKDSYSAAKKASNAIFKMVPKKKKMVKFILENQKPKKNGDKKQLAYNAYRMEEKTCAAASLRAAAQTYQITIQYFYFLFH